MVLREDSASPGPRGTLPWLSASRDDIIVPVWLRRGLVVESRKTGGSDKQRERSFWDDVLPGFQKGTQSSNVPLPAF